MKKFGRFKTLYYLCSRKPTIRWSGFYLWMWDANRSMTNLFRTLAVDGYLRSVEVINAEIKNVTRLFVRFLANTDDTDILENVRYYLEEYVESTDIKVTPYYTHDDQWGIIVKYVDEGGCDREVEVSNNTIYEMASFVCVC